MATGISISGYQTQVPGVFSSVDTTNLLSVGLTATGRVALLGTAEGGVPYTAIQSPSDIPLFTQPSQAMRAFRSGDLKEATAIAFDPSSDANIVGGAQSVICLKVNPSTQASTTLPGSMGAVATLTSRDYGDFANHIGVQVAQGSAKGSLISISDGLTTETADNLGGDAAFSLSYNGGSKGWQKMTAGVVTGGGIVARGQVTAASKAGDITNQPASPGALGINSDAADAGLALTVYGQDASGQSLIETYVLGQEPVGTEFAAVFGAAIWAKANSKAVSVFTVADGKAVLSIAASKQFAGIQPLEYAYVANAVVQVKSTGSGTGVLMLVPQGAPTQAEAIALDGDATKTSAGSYGQLMGLVTGGLDQQSAEVSADAASTSPAAQTTVGAILAYFDARQALSGSNVYGFIADAGETNTTQVAGQFDVVAQSDCKAPAEAEFTDTLYSVINWVNQNSSLVSAEVAPGAQGAIAPMASPAFLAGGREGVATFADYQKALNILQGISVDTIVPLTCSPDVAAAVDAHCAFMNSPKGRNERSGIVGIAGADGVALPTKKEALGQALALNTRNLSATPMGLVRFDTTGSIKQFSPAFAAVAAAGMAAGNRIGGSLTNKYLKTQSMVTSRQLDPNLDADDLIQGGLLFTRLRDGQGYYWVRDVTTYVQQTNLALQERGVNYLCNYVVKRLRLAAETVIGLPAFAGSPQALQSVLIGELVNIAKDQLVTSYTSPVVTQNNDTFLVEVSVQPSLPVNFVLLTLGVDATSNTTARAA